MYVRACVCAWEQALEYAPVLARPREKLLLWGRLKLQRMRKLICLRAHKHTRASASWVALVHKHLHDHLSFRARFASVPARLRCAWNTSVSTCTIESVQEAQYGSLLCALAGARVLEQARVRAPLCAWACLSGYACVFRAYLHMLEQVRLCVWTYMRLWNVLQKIARRRSVKLWQFFRKRV